MFIYQICDSMQGNDNNNHCFRSLQFILMLSSSSLSLSSKPFLFFFDRNAFKSWYDFPCDMNNNNKKLLVLNVQKVIVGRIQWCLALSFSFSSIIRHKMIHFRYFSVSDYIHQTQPKLFTEKKKISNQKKQFVYVYGIRNRRRTNQL